MPGSQLKEKMFKFLGQGHKNQGFVKRHQLTSHLIQAILHGLECRKFCLVRL